jgi:hypothetical protein
MIFVIVSVICAFFGRRLGSALSKHFLYFAPMISVIVASIIWGGLVALLMHKLVVWQHPHWILKWIFGFAQGAYVSVPNFGLVAESTIPQEEMLKHNLIFTIPCLAFIVSSVLFAYLL